jgi:DNA repair protein RadA/Sms
VPLAAIGIQPASRSGTGIGEVDRVLGGGLVAGALMLLGGEPGIGKSTLVLELAAGIARSGTDDGRPVLYASGEESSTQLHLRADRLALTSGAAGERIHVLSETDLETILEVAERMAPRLLVVDSIQTLTADGLEGPAGSVGQVREAAARLGSWAHGRGVPVVLVGHVTKDGSLAGPRTLEHLVDVVMLLEGDRYGSLRVLRAAKNRFGSTEEVGVLEMSGDGLREVPDPARAFLGDGHHAAAGVAVAAVLEGTRPFLVEVQALTASAGMGLPRRTVAGVDRDRLALLVAVLGRHAGVDLAAQDLYVSLAGGANAEEPALDLPLALALASSHRGMTVLPATVACGEVSLLGDLRPVRGLERRLREAARLGFEAAIVPSVGSDAHTGDLGTGVGVGRAGMRLLRAGTLREALGLALRSGPGTSGEG